MLYLCSPHGAYGGVKVLVKLMPTHHGLPLYFVVCTYDDHYLSVEYLV